MGNDAPAVNPSRNVVTVRQELILIGIVVAIVAGLGTIDLFERPASADPDKHTLFTVLQGIAMALGQAMWISMDRTRRGHEVGWWRFGAIFLGPLAIWLYLVSEYKVRGLALVLASVGLYLLAFFLPAVLYAFVHAL